MASIRSRRERVARGLVCVRNESSTAVDARLTRAGVAIRTRSPLEGPIHVWHRNCLAYSVYPAKEIARDAQR